MQAKEYASYVIAFSATLIRYYDYALFGLSASIISKTFMPGLSDTNQMLSFFAIYSIAVFARPIGSLIFGKIGDKMGRIEAVKIATGLAAVSTSLITFIPGYNSIGWLAIILLTICRMLFLMSLSGDIDVIKVYVAEKISKKRRNFANGLVSFFGQIGVLLAAYMYHFSMSFDELTWLWRLNFLIGGIFGFFVVLMRNFFQESEAFLKSKLKVNYNSDRLIHIIKLNKIKFILTIIINGFLGGGYNFLIIFLSTFTANIADIIDSELAEINNIKLIAIYGFSCLIAGFTADKVSGIKQAITALALSLICIFIMQIMASRNISLVQVHMALVLLAPFYMIPIQIKLQSLFSIELRMRMYSLSHSLGSMIFSSTTPFFCMLLWKYTESFAIVLSFFMLMLGLVFFALIYIDKKNYPNMFET